LGADDPRTALAAGREAVALLRDPVDRAGRVRLAAAQGNLAAALEAGGEHEEALVVRAASITLMREIVQTMPRRLDYLLEDAAESGARVFVDADRSTWSGATELTDVLVMLAGSLREQAQALQRAGRRDEAVAPADEAVEILRDLAAEDYDAHVAALGAALGTKAFVVMEVDPEAGLSIATEALDVLREIVAEHPHLLDRSLVLALAPLTWALVVLRRWRDALEAMQQLAAVIPREDVGTLSLMQREFDNISAGADGDGDGDLAVVAAQASVEVAREIVALDERRPSVALIGALQVLSRRLSAVGAEEPALDAAVEAVRSMAAAPAQQLGDGAAGAVLGRYLRARKAAGAAPDLSLPLVTAVTRAWQGTSRQAEELSSLVLATFEVIEWYRAADRVDDAAACLDAVYQFCHAHPQHWDARFGYAMVGYNVVESLVGQRRHRDAEVVVQHLVELASTEPDRTVREAGKAAFTLIGGYSGVDDKAGVGRVARMADRVLRSPAYLAARREELGEESPQRFLHALDAAGTAQPVNEDAERSWWRRRPRN
jgi:tetratricopeptide (TPR) repeat protein